MFYRINIMKILRIVMVLVMISAVAAVVMRAEEQPKELSGFSAVPEAIQPGVQTTFIFVFNVPMDTSENPNILFNIPDDDDLIFPTYWDGQYKCKLSYSFPNVSESVKVKITLTGAKTKDGKDVGDINEFVKIIPGANPDNW
jgi:hypothetical protein